CARDMGDSPLGVW
nr:immunoglobulin heavy chain junction region [Macaca mulatta]MOW88052.1 immunoglobulin heavy chain junction region [Macaca mulatta]MOW88127.1 immunoglobulin heavy chain junction region [Macaca mulatta]MOW89226.1 immunoglobulin heavy chain junction region [Macaca mulatta]MOW89382.1 immunoglobulin heavy chain junction region [Macaca mulatta]